jgi:hypothetical protein
MNFDLTRLMVYFIGICERKIELIMKKVNGTVAILG